MLTDAYFIVFLFSILLFALHFCSIIIDITIIEIGVRTFFEKKEKRNHLIYILPHFFLHISHVTFTTWKHKNRSIFGGFYGICVLSLNLPFDRQPFLSRISFSFFFVSFFYRYYCQIVTNKTHNSFCLLNVNRLHSDCANIQTYLSIGFNDTLTTMTFVFRFFFSFSFCISFSSE